MLVYVFFCNHLYVVDCLLFRTGDGKLASFFGDTTIREVRDEGDGRKIPVTYIRRKKK